MISCKKIYFLLCLLLVALPVAAQEKTLSDATSCIPVRTVSYDKLAFDAGEEMSFTLHYKWGAINSDVGTATVELDTLTYNGEKAFRCTVLGKTTKFFDFFFKVREDFRSWFTCDGLKPLRFTRDTFEGNYRAKNSYYYDWKDDEPHIKADVFSSSRGQRDLQLPLTKCTFDLPALFFYARNMDMSVVEPGRKYPMTFAIDDEIYNVYFILYGKETIKVKGFGTVNTIKFAAKLLEGEVFSGEEDMMVWISDDENRIPVYFEAPLLVGNATGRITSVKGLKHPFTSLVDDKRK